MATSGRSISARSVATVFYATDPELIAVPIGAFADPTFPPPTISVYELRRHPWVTVPAAERDDF